MEFCRRITTTKTIIYRNRNENSEQRATELNGTKRFQNRCWQITWSTSVNVPFNSKTTTTKKTIMSLLLRNDLWKSDSTTVRWRLRRNHFRAQRLLTKMVQIVRSALRDLTNTIFGPLAADGKSFSANQTTSWSGRALFKLQRWLMFCNQRHDHIGSFRIRFRLYLKHGPFTALQMCQCDFYFILSRFRCFFSFRRS